jgi:hypothetical protein
MVSFDLSSSAKGTRRTDQYHRFLLKYAARDQVELLGRGNGGIVEIRNAIAQYEEPSAPLFGFLRYRRRNVVIKYVPEECSRLVQGEPLPDDKEKSSDEN